MILSKDPVLFRPRLHQNFSCGNVICVHYKIGSAGLESSHGGGQCDWSESLLQTDSNVGTMKMTLQYYWSTLAQGMYLGYEANDFTWNSIFGS